jgi:hypothetical protein
VTTKTILSTLTLKILRMAAGNLARVSTLSNIEAMGLRSTSKCFQDNVVDPNSVRIGLCEGTKNAKESNI